MPDSENTAPRAWSPVDVAIWGRLPPPIGGVTRSTERLARNLRASGHRTVVVDPRRPRGVADGLVDGVLARRSRTLQLFNIAGWRSPRALEAFTRLSRGHHAVVLHSAWLISLWADLSPRRRETFGQLLRAQDAIWVTNAQLLELTEEIGAHGRTRVVSPWSPVVAVVPPDAHAAPRTTRRYLLVAAHRGEDLYGLDIAVDAVRRLREAGDDDLLLVALVYGGIDPAGEQFLAHASDLEWVMVHRELDEAATLELVGRAEAVLRPTATDGDSVLVRDALAMGIRVLASPCVPRPVGTELVDRTAEALSNGYLHGGAAADGEGLGDPINVVVEDYLRSFRSERTFGRRT